MTTDPALAKEFAHLAEIHDRLAAEAIAMSRGRITVGERGFAVGLARLHSEYSTHARHMAAVFMPRIVMP